MGRDDFERHGREGTSRDIELPDRNVTRSSGERTVEGEECGNQWGTGPVEKRGREVVATQNGEEAREVVRKRKIQREVERAGDPAACTSGTTSAR